MTSEKLFSVYLGEEAVGVCFVAPTLYSAEGTVYI
jgi:hypothetical protein